MLCYKIIITLNNFLVSLLNAVLELNPLIWLQSHSCFTELFIYFFPGFGGSPFEFNFGNILAHIGYLPEHLGYNWLQVVYWSLEAEFHYYILIGLLLPVLWKSKWSLIASFAIALILSFFIKLYVFIYMPFFIIGIVTCARKVNKINSYIYFLTIIGCCVVCIIQHKNFGFYFIGVVTSLTILYFKFENPITVFLGKISFSLYLIHIPVGGRILNYAGRYVNTEFTAWLALIIALSITLFAAWIFYKVVEYPSQILAKRIRYGTIEKSINNIPAFSSN